MLALRESAVVLGVVVLVSARWLPPAARRRAAGVAAVVVVAAATTLLPSVRWPVLVVVAVAAVTGAEWLLRRRSGGRPSLAGAIGCLLVTVGGGLAAWALPVPVFPQPSGPSRVGTTVVQWTDPGWAEPATADPADRRTVVVQLWYPADAAAGRAQYLGRDRDEARTVAAGVAGYLGVPALLLDAPPRARSHAAPEAAPAAGRFPVVLFSPGLGGVRTQNTAWAEDLASRGYVVAGVDHPYDSAAVVLADGRTVRTRVAATGDAAEDDRRTIGWTAVRAADLSFVLTQLGRLDRGELPGPFAGRLDTARAAATGHSIGGAAAMRAAARDRRFVSVIDLDGGPNSDQKPVGRPVLALTHAPDPRADGDYRERLTAVLGRSSATGYLLTVPGSTHASFTDAPLFLPPVPGVAGSLGRTGSVRMTTGTCAAFLDATLRDRAVDLPAALARFGDLRLFSPSP